MEDNSMIITDACELHDDVLIRKIIECRQQVRQLSAYRSEEVARATSSLAKLIARMESEAKRRELPITKLRAFRSGGSIEA